MDDALQIVIEMSDNILNRFRRGLEGITQAEADWRPLPEANSIALIVRHLFIEAQWHRACLERGEPMPSESTHELLQQIDAVPMDFEGNLKAFDEAFASFLATLQTMTRVQLQERTRAAYHAGPSCSAHFLGFHQAMHVAMHLGQIHTIRNLHEKTRGQKARFFPDNPTFPKS